MEDRVMVRCASLFSQLVGLFSRGQFHHLVKKHRAERYSKGVGSWDHFVALPTGPSQEPAGDLRWTCLHHREIEASGVDGGAQ